VSALIGAFVLSVGLQFGAGLDPDNPRSFALLMLFTVTGTTVIWLAVTYLTAPEPRAHLKRFYERVRPGGSGWTEVVGDADEEGPGKVGFLHWAAGCAIVYLGLFGVGQLLLGRPWRGWLLVFVALALTMWVVYRSEGAEIE